MRLNIYILVGNTLSLWELVNGVHLFTEDMAYSGNNQVIIQPEERVLICESWLAELARMTRGNEQSFPPRSFADEEYDAEGREIGHWLDYIREQVARRRIRESV